MIHLRLCVMMAALCVAPAAFAQADAARAAEASGRYVDALAAHTRAIAAAPKDVGVRVQRAQLFGVLGYPEVAAGDYRVAVTLSPEDAGLQAGLCNALALAGRDLDSALAACEAAVTLEPENYAWLSARGLVHLKRGAFAAAEKDYAAALSLYPASPNEMFGYGIAVIHLGRGTEGRGEIASATLDSAGLPDAWAARGFGLKGEILPKPEASDRVLILNAGERAASVGACAVVTTEANVAGAWNGPCRFGLAHGEGRMSAYGPIVKLAYGREVSGAAEETVRLAYAAVEAMQAP